MQQSCEASPQRRLAGRRCARAADTEVSAQITRDQALLRFTDTQRDAALDVLDAQVTQTLVGGVYGVYAGCRGHVRERARKTMPGWAEHGERVNYEGIDFRSHDREPTSILPVTAALMRAWRRSRDRAICACAAEVTASAVRSSSSISEHTRAWSAAGGSGM